MNQVLFGNIRSYDDLGLFLADVDIGIPEPRRTVIDVPGRNGALDLTYSLSSEVTYKNRTITLTFKMADYRRRWISLFSAIAAALHSKRMQVVIQPDTGYYWDAFCTVKEAACDRNTGTVTVELDAYPYKFKSAETTYHVIPASIGKSQVCVVSGKSIIPEFYASNSGNTVTFGSITHSLAEAAAWQSFSDIIFSEGNNEVIITGTAGTVDIRYREGIL